MALFQRFRTVARALRFGGAGDREGHADQARLGGIRTAVRQALTSLAYEEQALRRQLTEASGTAAAIAGTDSVDHGERAPADERLLAEAERQMKAAARRLDALRAQRALFMAMLDLAGGGAAPGTRARPQ
ncbi:MAG: hypothetical protein J0H01_27510 [Rhizobiales bacterium]|nr:hypothetical protein [Hyphomicrobiales bacterium]